MAFMAMLLGSIAMLVTIFGIVLCLIGLGFLIVYITKRQPKRKKGFLIAAIVLLVFGIPTAFGIPTLIAIDHNNQVDQLVSPQLYPVTNAIAQHDNRKLARLLKNGADPNEMYDGQPALYWTSFFEFGADSEAAGLLIQAHADYNVRRANGDSLMQAILTDTIAATDETEVCKIVELLVRNGYDVDEADDNGVTLLMQANTNASYHIGGMLPYRVTKALVAGGADLDARDNMGRTALMWACGGRPDIEGYYAFTAFDADTIKYLIANGADVGVKDKFGFTALDYFQQTEKISEDLARDNEYFSDVVSDKEYLDTCASLEALLKGK